jgi:hypothetical protein
LYARFEKKPQERRPRYASRCRRAKDLGIGALQIAFAWKLLLSRLRHKIKTFIEFAKEILNGPLEKIETSSVLSLSLPKKPKRCRFIERKIKRS